MTLGSGSHLSQAQNSAQPKEPLEKVFPHSNKCKRCHERVFEEWEASPLSRSIHSPAFRASLEAYLAFSGRKDPGMCLRCHAPHVNVYEDQAPAFIEQVRSGDPAIDGVACSQCHLIEQVDRTKQLPKLKYALGKTLFGPYKDFVPNKAHESKDLDLFRKSNLCLNCHFAVPAAAELGKSNDLLGPWESSQATKVLEDTVLKPEETRKETFSFPTPKDTRSFDVEASLSYAPVAGPPAFLQRIEAESSKGAQDPVFQPIPIVKRTVNVPLK